MNAIVLDDGKIAIPEELRDALGFVPGTVLEMQSSHGMLMAWKRFQIDAFEKWRGRGRSPLSTATTDEYLRMTRDGDGR